MEELVKRIMNIEKQAAERLEFEKTKFGNPEADAENILAQKRLETESKLQERIAAIAASEAVEEEEKIKELNRAFEQKKSELISEFEKNKERFVNEIFERITG